MKRYKLIAVYGSIHWFTNKKVLTGVYRTEPMKIFSSYPDREKPISFSTVLKNKKIDLYVWRGVKYDRKKFIHLYRSY